MIYLDHAASSPLKKNVLQDFIKGLEEHFANPSAAHSLGKIQKKIIEDIKVSFLKSLGVTHIDDLEKQHLIFTGSATESNTLLLQGLEFEDQDSVLFNPSDHPSLVQNVKALQKRGVEAIPLKLNKNGIIEIDQFDDLKDRTVKLCVTSHVNNHNGAIQPIEKLGDLIKQNFQKCHFHVDAVQSFGLYEIQVKKSFIHSLTLSAHKIAGPKGIAALYLDSEKTIKPLFLGGGQQAGLRSGTELTPLIQAFDTARKEIEAEKIADYERRNLFLRENLRGISKRITFPFDLEETSPKILTFVVAGLSSDILIRHLSEQGIYLSSSSACSSKIKKKDPIFSALGITEELHKSVLRISLGWNNTDEQLEQFVLKFKEVLDDLEFLM